MTPLSELRPGQRATVVSVTGDGPLIQRLAELGLFEGETLTVVALAPLGDPIEVHLGNTRLTLRQQEASTVTVEPI